MALSAGRIHAGCRGRSLAETSNRVSAGARSGRYDSTGTQVAITPVYVVVPEVVPELLPPISAPKPERAEKLDSMLVGTIDKRDAGYNATQSPDGGLSSMFLSVALIGPDDRRRLAVTEGLAGTPCRVSAEMNAYPDLDRVAQIQEDIVILDLDSDAEVALELVEAICGSSEATVIVYSTSFDSELMLRSMRAGAREFLTLPLKQSALADAIVRTAARRSSARPAKKTDGRVHVFCGVKGGTGVTTIAVNFAISAARDSGGKVLLIDLDMPLGDAALQLGITPQYSTADALQNSVRLDSNFLSRLVAKHESGLSVLAAPGTFVSYQLNGETIAKLIQVARQEFEIVVIDAGSRFQLHGTALFDPEALVYLVTDVGVSELRNANRIISELFPASRPKLEIILNRFAPSALGMDDEHITKALTRPAQWRIPEDKSTLREMQSTATPLAERDTPVSRAIRQIARAACGLSAEPEKKKKILGLF